MHGFPDNLHIYDRLIPYLRDRQVITFDFLGWGTSDKPIDYPYTSKQQEGDLHAVLDNLEVEQVVLVPHDASGPVAPQMAGGTVRRGGSGARNTAANSFAPVCRHTEHLPGFHRPDE